MARPRSSESVKRFVHSCLYTRNSRTIGETELMRLMGDRFGYDNRTRQKYLSLLIELGYLRKTYEILKPNQEVV